MKIVALGDSIVNGYPMGRGSSFTGLLRSEYGYDIINKGVNGDTSYGMLERFKGDVLDKKADLLLIHAGTNDFIYGESLEAVMFNLKLMIQMAGDMKAAVLTPVPLDPDMAGRMWVAADYESALSRMMDYAEEIRRMEGIHVIDTQKTYLEYAKAQEEAYYDGIHPVAAGHSYLAEYINERLKEIL